MAALYTAQALATGEGRNGHVASPDGIIDMDLAVPEQMGGAGGAANPELLFAAGYSACFHSALQLVARQAQADVRDSAVAANVSIEANGQGGYQLAVVLEVILPHLEQEQAQQLADQAHRVCPYSNATRGNIEVEVRVVDE